MNFDFYIFLRDNKNHYYQYIYDSTKDIFQNIDIKSQEQLSIFHEDSLVYYIYTKQWTDSCIVGFCTVFNKAIFTDFNILYNLFRGIEYDRIRSIRSIRSKDAVIIEKLVDIWTNKIEITLELNKKKFVECGKTTYNLINDKKNNEKIFDTSGISTNKHLKIRAITKAIKQYQWVYILREEDIIKTTSDVKSNVKNNKKSRVVLAIKKIFILFILFILIVLSVGLLVLFLWIGHIKTTTEAFVIGGLILIGGLIDWLILIGWLIDKLKDWWNSL